MKIRIPSGRDRRSGHASLGSLTLWRRGSCKHTWLAPQLWGLALVVGFGMPSLPAWGDDHSVSDAAFDSLVESLDGNEPRLFAQSDDDGERLSLRQVGATLMVHVGGEVSYLVQTSGTNPLQRLIDGETLTLEAVAGHKLDKVAKRAHLKLTAPPSLNEDDSPTSQDSASTPDITSLSIRLWTSDHHLDIRQQVLAEPRDHEITVVSYNVENLFDQHDDDRNARYGDYRIRPNGSGQYSNYGDHVVVNGRRMSFTDIKIEGIRRVLTGIDPAGPEVVGLVEIESKAALDQLLAGVADLGYRHSVFSEWLPGMTPTAVGVGLISKVPVRDWSLIVPTVADDADAPRPILKACLDVAGHPLLVYVNHWKSKGAPESQRIPYATALATDLARMLADDPKLDYIILGDLNSEYNEAVIIRPEHNDTGGRTGINHVLRAQGDELAVLQGQDAELKYNLHYELPRRARRTAWHRGFDWSAMDHAIIGPGLYDERGLTYVDGSFQIATAAMPRMHFLFNRDGTPKRWRQHRENRRYTRHMPGGYSDHLPLFLRLRVPVNQTDAPIKLSSPGKPNPDDIP